MPDISRSKDNQTIKLDLLIKYNIRKVFLEDHMQNVVVKLVSEPYLKY